MSFRRMLASVFFTLCLPVISWGQELLWKTEVPGTPFGPPVIGADGSLFVLTADGMLRRFSSSGDLLWDFELQKEPSGSLVKFQGILLVPTIQSALQVVHSSGNGMWEFTLIPEIRGAPAVRANGDVAFCTEDGHLYLIDEGGNLLWRIPFPSFPSRGPVVDLEGNILVALPGSLRKYNGLGHLLWSYDLPGDIAAPLALGPSGEAIAVDEAGKLHCVDPETGDRRWMAVGCETSASPVVTWDMAIVCRSDGSLEGYRLETEDGDPEVIWSDSGGTGDVSPALAADGTLYVADSDAGAVHALDTQGGGPESDAARDLDLEESPQGLALASTHAGNLLAVTTEEGKIYCYGVDYGPGDAPWTQRGATALRQARLDEAPSVTLSGVAQGQTVTGEVLLEAEVFDDRSRGLSVRFMVDDDPLGTDAFEPFSLPWDSRGTLNGDRTVAAEVRDLSGRTARDTRTVAVENPAFDDLRFAANMIPYYFSWDPGDEARFRLEFAVDEAFLHVVTTSRDTSGNWISRPVWTPSQKKWKKILSVAKDAGDGDTIAYWRIRGKKNGVFQAGRYIVEGQAPPVPESPPDGFTVPPDLHPTFTWALENNKKVRIEFSETADFSSGVFVTSRTGDFPWIKGQVWLPPVKKWKKVLDRGGTVYWRIRARDAIKREILSDAVTLHLEP